METVYGNCLVTTWTYIRAVFVFISSEGTLKCNGLCWLCQEREVNRVSSGIFWTYTSWSAGVSVFRSGNNRHSGRVWCFTERSVKEMWHANAVKCSRVTIHVKWSLHLSISQIFSVCIVGASCELPFFSECIKCARISPRGNYMYHVL